VAEAFQMRWSVGALSGARPGCVTVLVTAPAALTTSVRATPSRAYSVRAQLVRMAEHHGLGSGLARPGCAGPDTHAGASLDLAAGASEARRRMNSDTSSSTRSAATALTTSQITSASDLDLHHATGCDPPAAASLIPV
jgi:hypothetical protein